MIAVLLNVEGFEYDIHSLVKAFYPESEVKVFTEGKKEVISDPGLPVIKLIRSSEKIELLLSVYSEKEQESGWQSGEGHPAVREEIGLDGGQDKAYTKNKIKQLIYQVLSEYTGTTLPWGTLTGIRPTKIALGLLEKGRMEAEILEYMKNTYYLNEEKGLLGIDIAKRERKLLSGIHCEEGYSLYVGIPFCPTTCLYCSFTSYPISVWRDRVSDYLTALEREMEDTAELLRGKILDSVYIGGGTPTTLEPDELERLLYKIRIIFPFTDVKEFTVEAGRADSITYEKLLLLKKYGVTRISINPQTMKQETLRLIGRQHTTEQVKEAFSTARDCGFDNINMDLILGLPGETQEDVRDTAEAIKALGPDSLTVHSLAIKKASRLKQWVQENGFGMIHNTDGMMRIAADAASAMGMKPYYLYRQKNMSGNFENVGYAREGCYGLYNILIMEEKQTIVAVGAGSISKRVYPDARIERSDNVKEIAQYIERIDEMIGRKRRLLED